MSSLAKQAREAMKAKASRLTTADPHQKVDSSNWTPAEPLNTEVKTGLRPVSRRAFKSGGKVSGAKAKANLGKKPRQSGGKAITADSLINRNVKEANEKRPGGDAHVGGYKKGGAPKRKGRDGGGRLPGERTQLEQARRAAVQAAEDYGMDSANNTENLRNATRNFENKVMETGYRDYKKGGRAKSKKADGGSLEAAKQMMMQAQKTAGVPAGGIYGAGFTRTGAGSMSPAGALGKQKLKKGGATKHDDVKQDMALIKKMVKPEARKGKAIGGAFGQFLSPALMLANAIRGEDKKRGGKATRKGREDGGVAIKKIPIGVSGLNPEDKAKWDKELKGSYTWREKPEKFTPMYEEPQELTGNLSFKKGGKAKRTARKEGGGVFSGPGYPGKIPGVVPGGREARATGGKTKGKGKTNINIMIAAGKPGMNDMMPPGGPTLPPGMDSRPGGIAPVPMAPPPGEGPGAAPMPMPIPMPMPMAGGAPGGPPPIGRKSGGRLTKVAHSYKDMEAGAGSGEGRLQKTDIAKFKAGRKAGGKVGHRTYRSYKDMDAGAGSGLGRLEKTEIQAHKK